MNYVYVVYRESDAKNLAAFTSYELAERYIELVPAEEREDYFIDRLQLLNV